MENKFFYKIFNTGYSHACRGGKVQDNPYPQEETERHRQLHMAWKCGFRAYWERD